MSLLNLSTLFLNLTRTLLITFEKNGLLYAIYNFGHNTIFCIQHAHNNVSMTVKELEVFVLFWVDLFTFHLQAQGFITPYLIVHVDLSKY